MSKIQDMPLPKFGEWDVNDPATAAGFTVIFNRAREEKKANGSQSWKSASYRGSSKKGKQSHKDHLKCVLASGLGSNGQKIWRIRRPPLVSGVRKAFNVVVPDQGIALRGLFIIDKEGVIQQSTINNLAIGRSVDQTLRTLQALQSLQDNPDDEFCPPGLKPGEKSMKPDPKLREDYFAAIL